ncbi:type II secretion system F family protein [Rhodocyclaceae bacterium SMB388]
MAEFAYRAATLTGDTRRGSVSADSRETALRQLRNQGLTPISVQAPGPESAHAGDGGAVMPAAPAPAHARRRWTLRAEQGPNRADVLILTTELAVMLKAGLPLDRALRVMAGMTPRAPVAALVEDLLASVKAGKPFSQALDDHRALFGEFYINLLRAGETSGHLADTLAQLAAHLEKVSEIRESVISALTYPAILLVVAVLSVALMLGFVVPQFETLFDDMGEALPWPTRALLIGADFVTAWGPWLLAAMPVALLLGRRALLGPAGRRWRDARLLQLPVLGRVLREADLTRFARSLGTLIGNGVPIVGAIRIAIDTMNLQGLRDAIAPVPDAIKRGERLADALAPAHLFSPLALNMVRLGEETGRLDAMLLELARVQERGIQSAIKRALTLIEPVLILLLGGVIAGIMAAILMGILSVNELVL